MERIKDLRSVTLPSGNLARRDVQSQLVAIPTGKFTRNCVLTGKSAPDMDYPIYLRPPGLIQSHAGISPEGLGYFTASEGTATNVFPKHNAISTDSDYWAASSLGCWIAYHHELRPTMLRGYRFITYNGYTPRVWRVEGSNDNATWTTLHSVTVDWTWGDGKQVVEQEVPLANRDYFMHHRLIVDEFDASSIWIYYLQFWDAACPSAADFYLDADAENPCQLAFADGYKTDGSPKDVLFTINTGNTIDAVDILQEPDILFNTEPIPCVLFSIYDPNESSVSFSAESQFNEEVLNPISHGYIYADHGGYGADPNFAPLFDGDIGTSYDLNSSYKYIHVKLTNPVFSNRVQIRANSSGRYFKMYISEDSGETWLQKNTPTFSGTEEKYVEFDRIYNVTDLKIEYANGSVYVYEIRFCGAGYQFMKISNGEIYEYDVATEQWDKTYKLPLGYFSLWKNPDGTAWEIGPFTPTHIPQMAIAPFFRKTSGGVAL